MRSVPLVDIHLVMDIRLAARAFDRGLQLVLGHITSATVLKGAAQCGVGVRVRSTRLDGDVDLLRYPRELLRHLVPAGEHGGFSSLKYASHRSLQNRLFWH